MWSTFTLTRIALHALADDPTRVVVEYASEGTMVDGSPYQNRYLALGAVRDGLIQRWTEYSDPAPIERALAAVQATPPTVGGNTMASASQVVNEYLAAFWSGDFDKARSLVADDFSFRGPLAQADTKDAFFASAAPLAPTYLTVYWATGCINSSFLFYYESQHDPQPPSALRVDVPVGVALFPRENPVTGPREWADAMYNIVRWTEMPRGGHFPAAEEPELLAAELREFFGPLR